MHAVWHWLLYLLTWASADPGLVERERARAAGCVIVSYAALAPEPTPAPRRDDGKQIAPASPAANSSAPAVNVLAPAGVAERKKNDHVFPTPPLPPAAPCLQCSDTGRIYRSDGGWVRCPCQCPGGRCPPTKR